MDGLASNNFVSLLHDGTSCYIVINVGTITVHAVPRSVMIA